MTEYLNRNQFLQLQTKTKALRDWLLVTVQYETGCTVSELINIKREDIHEQHIYIQQRECRVSDDLLAKLSTYVHTHNSPYLFPSRQQPKLTAKRVQQIIKKYLQELDVALTKETPHVLRYTHIAHAIQQNIPLSAIKQQTGLGEMRLSQIVSEVACSQEDAYARMFT